MVCFIPFTSNLQDLLSFDTLSEATNYDSLESLIKSNSKFFVILYSLSGCSSFSISLWKIILHIFFRRRSPNLKPTYLTLTPPLVVRLPYFSLISENIRRILDHQVLERACLSQETLILSFLPSPGTKVRVFPPFDPISSSYLQPFHFSGTIFFVRYIFTRNIFVVWLLLSILYAPFAWNRPKN